MLIDLQKKSKQKISSEQERARPVRVKYAGQVAVIILKFQIRVEYDSCITNMSIAPEIDIQA